jgi:hypothetical protein
MQYFFIDNTRFPGPNGIGFSSFAIISSEAAQLDQSFGEFHIAIREF